MNIKRMMKRRRIMKALTITLLKLIKYTAYASTICFMSWAMTSSVLYTAIGVLVILLVVMSIDEYQKGQR